MMARVALPGLRSSFNDVSSGFVVTIPSKKNIFLVLFLSAWLVGWCAGFFGAGSQLLNGHMKDAGGTAFLATWLVGWTVGGGFAFFIWFWMIFGKEIITLKSDALCIKKDIKGFGKEHEYDLSHLKNLRVMSGGFNPFDFSSAMRFWGYGGGLIAFDYGAKTFRFGSSIDEAEADIIISKLKERGNFK